MMPLERFNIPAADTRLIKHGDTVYKFKLQYNNGHNCRPDGLPCDADTMQKELEKVLRAVLKNQQDLQPMKTDHFIAFPRKCPWEVARKLEFFEHGKKIKVSPYVFHIYLDDNVDRQMQGRSIDGQSLQEREPLSQQHSKKPSTPPPSSQRHSKKPSTPPPSPHHSKKRNVRRAAARDHNEDEPTPSCSGYKPQEFAGRGKRSKSSDDGPRRKRPARQGPQTRSSNRSPHEGTTAEIDGVPGNPEELS